MRVFGTKREADVRSDDEGDVRIPADAGYDRRLFAAALAQTRQDRKLIVAEMAAQLGIGRAFLAQLERGEADPTWPVLQLIRERLHWTDFAGTEEVVPLPYNRFADLQNRAARTDSLGRRLELAEARIKELDKALDDRDVENDRLREALRSAVEALSDMA